MAEYAFTNAKWGESYGGRGATVYWSFATFNTSDAIYQFDAQISDETYRNLVRKAFDAWEGVASIDFVEVADGAQSQIRLGWDYIDGSYNTVGQAQYSYYVSQSAPFNQLSEAAIRFDTSEAWSTNMNYVGNDVNFYTVAVHEIGHAIGLAHVDDPSSIMYASSNDTVTLSAGDIAGVRALYGSAASSFVATSGNDLFRATVGDDYVNGLGGRDTVVYAGTVGSFGVGISQGVVTVAGTSRDQLVNIERIEFTDGTLAFDLNGNAGQIYRLYQAAFNRPAEKEGLGFWIRHLDEGRSDINSIADSFMNSAEFVRLYGTQQTVTNTKYVELLYNNTLGRASDQGGLKYWVNELDSGKIARDDILALFAESAENQSRVAGAIGDGIWYV